MEGDSKAGGRLLLSRLAQRLGWADGARGQVFEGDAAEAQGEADRAGGGDGKTALAVAKVAGLPCAGASLAAAEPGLQTLWLLL